jgi:hypothetical protein
MYGNAISILFIASLMFILHMEVESQIRGILFIAMIVGTLIAFVQLRLASSLEMTTLFPWLGYQMVTRLSCSEI